MAEAAEEKKRSSLEGIDADGTGADGAKMLDQLIKYAKHWKAKEVAPLVHAFHEKSPLISHTSK